MAYLHNKVSNEGMVQYVSVHTVVDVMSHWQHITATEQVNHMIQYCALYFKLAERERKTSTFSS